MFYPSKQYCQETIELFSATAAYGHLGSVHPLESQASPDSDAWSFRIERSAAWQRTLTSRNPNNLDNTAAHNKRCILQRRRMGWRGDTGVAAKAGWQRRVGKCGSARASWLSRVYKGDQGVSARVGRQVCRAGCWRQQLGWT